jgi:hypothetical protein
MTENNPVVATIRHEIDKIRSQALGPHLDTPIYDTLAREYDAKYSNMQYFETDLGKRLTNMHKFVARHAS